MAPKCSFSALQVWKRHINMNEYKFRNLARIQEFFSQRFLSTNLQYSKLILVNISVYHTWQKVIWQKSIDSKLQNSTGRIQMDSRTWSQISDPGICAGMIPYIKFRNFKQIINTKLLVPEYFGEIICTLICHQQVVAKFWLTVLVIPRPCSLSLPLLFLFIYQ